MERPQALKDRHRNSRKKIRRYSHFPKRSAVIAQRCRKCPVPQSARLRGPKLWEKNIENLTSYLRWIFIFFPRSKHFAAWGTFNSVGYNDLNPPLIHPRCFCGKYLIRVVGRCRYLSMEPPCRLTFHSWVKSVPTNQLLLSFPIPFPRNFWALNLATYGPLTWHCWTGAGFGRHTSDFMGARGVSDCKVSVLGSVFRKTWV